MRIHRNYIFYYLFQALLDKIPSSGLVIGKPKLTTTQCVVFGIIRSSGIVVNVCNIAKNIRDKSTDLMKGWYKSEHLLT